jgi:hypothetical protein
MLARRRWATVAEASPSDRARALGASVRHTPRSNCHNERYRSARADLDHGDRSARFVPTASIESWRESIRTDEVLRAAVLNPVDYEPTT